MIVLEQQN